jgi:hypothetical protein
VKKDNNLMDNPADFIAEICLEFEVPVYAS